MNAQGQNKGEEEERTKKSKKERRKEEVQKLLARMLSEESVREQLSAWQQCIDPSSFVLNPNALSGPLHDRFLARLCKHHRRNINSASTLRRFVSCFGSPSSDLDAAFLSQLRLVFHGTPERNVDSILRLGMLPSYRRGKQRCDWFAYGPYISSGYTFCRVTQSFGTKLLVFLVLPVKKAVCKNNDMKNVLTVKCASYQLPIGTVELVRARAPGAQSS